MTGRGMSQTPEEKAREVIDRLLEKAGWAVQDFKHINLRVKRRHLKLINRYAG